MNGLRSRLEALEGVEGIELELGDSGLEGITIRIREGADEVSVLDGVRRLLVAYGTKSPRLLAAAAPMAMSESGPGGGEGETVGDRAGGEGGDPGTFDEDQPGRFVSSSRSAATMRTRGGDLLELSVVPAGEQATAQVSLTRGDRSIRRRVPGSARAIVQAVIDAAAELAGREPISVMGMSLSSIEGTRVLTVIAGNHASTPRVSTVSVVDSKWPAALLEVVDQILGDPSDPA